MTQIPNENPLASRPTRRSGLMIGAVLLVFALLAGVFWLSTRNSAPELPAPQEAPGIVPGN